MRTAFVLRRGVRTFALLATLTALVSCGSGSSDSAPGPTPPAPVTTVSVSVAPAALALTGAGATASLSATVTTSAGVAASPTVTWTSGNPSVATVVGSGATATVTTVAPGTATITATSGGQSGSAAVTVTPPAQTLTVTVAGAGAGSVTSSPAGITCSSGTCTSAFVAGTTVTLTAASAPGSALEAWSGACSGAGSCTVVMSQARAVTATFRVAPVRVTTVTIAPTVIDVDEGATTLLTATARDAAGNVVTGRTTVWRSSDTTIATVSTSGVVSGRTEGDTVRITAVVDSVQATAQVVVRSLFFLASDVAAGALASCAIRVSGGAYCWGERPLGASGARTGGNRNLVSGSADFTRVVMGEEHGCALDRAGRVFCWGSNGEGQLGNGTFGTGVFAPVPIVGGQLFTQLFAGFYQTCAVNASSRAYCWGNNRFGQLAVGSSEVFVTRPTLVSGGDLFAMLDPGSLHSCGVTTAGVAKCWGDQTGLGPDNRGALGDGSGTGKTVPTPVAGSRQWTTIAVGNAHSCALDTGGAAWCWGRNREGQLGTGTFTSTLVPTAVSTSLRFTSITAGVHHTCAIATTNDAYCWGANASGQVGNGTTAIATLPARVDAGAVQFRQIVGGNEHTCAIAIDRKLYCWGTNGSGQTGTSAGGAVTRPTVVSRP